MFPTTLPLPPSSFPRELKDMETVVRCHMSMGSLHTEQGDLEKALQAYEEACKVARKEKMAVQEAAAYEYMAAVSVCSSAIRP